MGGLLIDKVGRGWRGVSTWGKLSHKYLLCDQRHWLGEIPRNECIQ